MCLRVGGTLGVGDTLNTFLKCHSLFPQAKDTAAVAAYLHPCGPSGFPWTEIPALVAPCQTCTHAQPQSVPWTGMQPGCQQSSSSERWGCCAPLQLMYTAAEGSKTPTNTVKSRFGPLHACWRSVYLLVILGAGRALVGTGNQCGVGDWWGEI